MNKIGNNNQFCKFLYSFGEIPVLDLKNLEKSLGSKPPILNATSAIRMDVCLSKTFASKSRISSKSSWADLPVVVFTHLCK